MSGGAGIQTSGLTSKPACFLLPHLINGERASPGTLQNHPGQDGHGELEGRGQTLAS